MADLPVPDEDGMEFNRYTLTGEHDALFVALLCFVEADVGPDNHRELLRRLRGHIARGVGNLAVRLKSPVDVSRLVVEAL